jgi:lactate dehydrogenase-like 2-hydroxyacid dehydrogenase
MKPDLPIVAPLNAPTLAVLDAYHTTRRLWLADEPRVPEALLRLDSAVLQPHQRSAASRTRQAMGQLVIDNLAAWVAGKRLVTPAN